MSAVGQPTGQPTGSTNPSGAEAAALCPACGSPMRKEYDGVRQPPMPRVFWFCTNARCPEGKDNLLFQGG